jgi:hypothetical protein
VYQVRHILTGQIRAVKIIDTSKMEDNNSTDLLREVEILKTLVK